MIISGASSLYGSGNLSTFPSTCYGSPQIHTRVIPSPYRLRQNYSGRGRCYGVVREFFPCMPSIRTSFRIRCLLFEILKLSTLARMNIKSRTQFTLHHSEFLPSVDGHVQYSVLKTDLSDQRKTITQFVR